MILFNSQNTRVPSTENFNIITKVNQLTNFDMIYVYHLLSIGTKLNLYKCDNKLNGDLVFKVMFRTFKLGYISVTSFSKLLFTDELELEATIFSIAKERYLPLNNLEITITKSSLKMVG